MRSRSADPRIFLLTALAAGAAALLTNPGSRPLLQVTGLALFPLPM
ncbi:MAG: hypothetical protein R6W82_03680 [bacterium]